MIEKKKAVVKQSLADKVLIPLRVIALITVNLMFFPALNPSRFSTTWINKNLSLFSSAISYSKLSAEIGRPLRAGWITEKTMIILYICLVAAVVGLVVLAAGVCMTVGEIKLKTLGIRVTMLGSAIAAISFACMYFPYNDFYNTSNFKSLAPNLPTGLPFMLIASLVIFVYAGVVMIMLPKPVAEDKYEMQLKYKLFLMLLPFIELTFLFSYFPLYGWRVTLFNYQPGYALNADNFVGFKWFTYLFKDAATRNDMIRVMRNTLIMSGLGIGTSWLAMVFAIFMSEIRHGRSRKLLQTMSTIPNFISWVLVYAFALAMFSSDGFVNSLFKKLIDNYTSIMFLEDKTGIWFKMLAWGIWKGLGWSAIIYIAAISGIDQQLYEAATVDGAGRFRRMWHITVPSLLPTYFVLLMLSIAGILSNGMDQYYVFENPVNTSQIEVLDLYVYNLGLNNGSASNIALATVVGMLKSCISVVLLFIANKASKLVRGETIV